MILYLGNFTSLYGHQKSQIELLAPKLSSKYDIIFGSYFKNKILRFFDFIYKIIINSNSLKLIIFDVYSSNYFYLIFLSSLIAKILNIKYICILHGGNLPARLKNNPIISRIIFGNSADLISPSEFLKNEFNKYNYKSKIIYNSVSHPLFNNCKPRKVINPKFLYVRSLMDLYNPLMAVKILNELVQFFPDTKLTMIGSYDKKNYNKIMDYVALNKLNNNFKYMGLLTKDEWFELSNDYDIYLSTTNIDNTPVSLIEAYNLGMVVASTNVGGVPYICENNNTGILFDPVDYKKAAKHILNFFNKKNLPNICENGFKYGKRFQLDNVINDWYNIIDTYNE